MCFILTFCMRSRIGNPKVVLVCPSCSTSSSWSPIMSGLSNKVYIIFPSHEDDVRSHYSILGLVWGNVFPLVGSSGISVDSIWEINGSDMFTNNALIFSTSTMLSRLGSFLIGEILVLSYASGADNSSFWGDSVFVPIEFDLIVSSNCCWQFPVY